MPMTDTFFLVYSLSDGDASKFEQIMDLELETARAVLYYNKVRKINEILAMVKK